MTLPGPILDDRTYDQLRDELLRRIPVYAPEWTNHNASDPGVALLELFAYLGESVLFRFNQIPDATKIAFLNLLGVRPRPAQCARVLLSASTERTEGVQVLKGTEARAGAVSFETEDEVYVWPVQALAVGKFQIDEPEGLEARAQVRERRRREDAASRARRTGPHAATGNPIFYQARRVSADPADPPLDVSHTVDQSLWVALLGERSVDIKALLGRTLFLGVAFDETIPAPFDLVEAVTPGEGIPAGAGGGTPRWQVGELMVDPPAVLWELWQGSDGSGDQLTVLAVDGDTTRGMTTTGVVKITIPQFLPDLPLQPSGGRFSPPPLEDPKEAAKVLAWLRVRRPPNENDAIHRIRWVGSNAVHAAHSRVAAAELLGWGNGNPDQAFQLTQRPVISGTVELEVEEVGGWTRWSEVETLALSQPLDRHFALDTGSGLVRFGTRSRAPQIGERVRVVSYRYGGGSAGNVSAGAVSALSGIASVKVTNVLPATGGADPASLTAALADIPARVHRRDRAVTGEDFRALTLEVPGVRRAETLPLFHPDTPSIRRPGAVSVLIFPEEDLRNPAAPLPDTALLRRVAAYLEPRRLITTELYVIPPTYREVAISVGIHVAEGYQIDAVRRWVELLLRQYLAPVPNFGPAGQGWPLGRAVRRAELEAIAVQVEGVDYIVDDLRLAARNPGTPGTGGTSAVWQQLDLVELAPWEVPQLSAITVVGGTPPAAGKGYQPPADHDMDALIVPLPPDVCR
jgi:hypothetical protein